MPQDLANGYKARRRGTNLMEVISRHGGQLFTCWFKFTWLRLEEGNRALAKRLHVYRMALHIKNFLRSIDSLRLWRTSDRILVEDLAAEFGPLQVSCYTEFQISLACTKILRPIVPST